MHILTKFIWLFRWRGMEVDPTPVSPWGTTTLCQIPSAWISRGHTSEVEVSVEVLQVRWTVILDISGTLPLAVDYQLWTPMMTGPDSWQVEAGLWGIAARHGSISAGDIFFFQNNKKNGIRKSDFCVQFLILLFLLNLRAKLKPAFYSLFFLNVFVPNLYSFMLARLWKSQR